MTSKPLPSRRGIVLTLDISIAMMVLRAAIALTYASYGSPAREGFDDQLMRGYLQDAATVMANKGYLSAPTESQNGTNTTGIREVLRATPSSVCMQVSGFGTAVGRDLGGYWKFDEDSGSVVSDSSGNGQSGTIAGGASLSTVGKNGHALTLDGSTGYVALSPINPSSAVSVTGWFRRRGPPVGGYHIIFMQGTQVELSSNDAGSSLRTGVTTDTAGRVVFDSGTGVDNGNWHFLALTYDGAFLRAYVDATQTGVTAVSGTLSTDASTNIGMYGGSYYANGSIDEVRIYSRALTPDEIKLLYSNPSNILYVVDKPECAFSGGEVQSLTVPFVSNLNQEENSYYYATLRAWLSGASK